MPDHNIQQPGRDKRVTLSQIETIHITLLHCASGRTTSFSVVGHDVVAEGLGLANVSRLATRFSRGHGNFRISIDALPGYIINVARTHTVDQRSRELQGERSLLWYMGHALESEGMPVPSFAPQTFYEAAERRSGSASMQQGSPQIIHTLDGAVTVDGPLFGCSPTADAGH